MHASQYKSDIVICQDSIGRYIPQFDQLESNGLDTLNLDLLACFFVYKSFECAAWYKKFIEDPTQTEIHTAYLRVAKNKHQVAISYRSTYLPNDAERAVILDGNVFVQALDQWCALVEQDAPKIFLTFDGKSITLQECKV